MAGMRRTRPLGGDTAFARISAEVRDAVEWYGERGWLDEPTGFFGEPEPLRYMQILPVITRRRRYERFIFDSGYQPDDGEPGTERWASYTGNDRVYGLLLRHPEPRPWLVCVHGAEMGRAGIDLALFRAWHLHETLGLNVILPVLPMHGPRARGLPRDKAIPGQEILDDVHFAAQAVSDVRRLLSWIRLQDPDSVIGLNGVSMGGYVSSLVASLDTDLTCAILGVPVANLVDVLKHHSGIGPDDFRYPVLEAAAPLGEMISPLSMKPQVAPQGRFIYGGVADRIVHPRDQVERLWEHWGQPEVVWYQGGHTGFFNARPVQQFIDSALLQSGLI